MLKINATDNLPSDVTLGINEDTGQPDAILRIASNRHNKGRNSNRIAAFISIKIRAPLAEYWAWYEGASWQRRQ